MLECFRKTCTGGEGRSKGRVNDTWNETSEPKLFYSIFGVVVNMNKKLYDSWKDSTLNEGDEDKFELAPH